MVIKIPQYFLNKNRINIFGISKFTETRVKNKWKCQNSICYEEREIEASNFHNRGNWDTIENGVASNTSFFFKIRYTSNDGP